MEEAFVFDRDYDEVISLADGTRVHLRLLRPEDREKLERGFERLSGESRYRRFLGPKSELSDEEIEYLTDVDQYNHIAIAAELAEGERAGEGIAVARCVRLHDDPDIAEAAVTVIDEFQHKGLGRKLLIRLVGAARERGIEKFRATLFSQNEPMRNLLREVGNIDIVENDGPVVTVDARIGGERGIPVPTPQEPEVELPPENPLRRVLSMTAEGVVSLVDKFLRPTKTERNEEPDGDTDADSAGD